MPGYVRLILDKHMISKLILWKCVFSETKPASFVCSKWALWSLNKEKITHIEVFIKVLERNRNMLRDMTNRFLAQLKDILVSYV